MGRVPFVLGISACLIASICSVSHADARSMQPSDFRNIVGLSAPAISPDGKRAVVVVSRIAWADDTESTDLDLIDIATHERRAITHDRKDLDAPAFSPDGTKLAFIADAGSGDNAQPQVWMLRFDGGDARPVTNAADGVLQFAWRPDGGEIAYTAADPMPKRTGADRFRDSFIFTTESITARSLPRPVHLFVIAADGGHARQLTSGAQSVATGQAQSTISWSADGKSIAFTLTPNAILNDSDRSYVDVVDAATGKLSKLTQHDAYESSPLYSPDGKHVAYAYSSGDVQSNQVEAFVTTPAGGEGTALSQACDCYLNDLAWLPDSSGVVMTAPEATSLTMLRAGLNGPPAPMPIDGLRVESPLQGAIAQDGSMVFVASDVKRPAELYLRASAGGTVKLTNYNDATAGLDLADAQTIEYRTTLGITGDALLLTPPGFDPHRKYPMVLKIHGGPTSASVRGFDELAQLMAARGWLVLEPNYRGSLNLGLKYLRSVLYDPDDGPGKDIMAAVNAVRARGFVDDRRIAVSGWSYGGIMTAWMISKYHIWNAAVSGASVNDWMTDYGVADDSDADVALFHGSPFVGNNAAEWRRVSAITYAADVTTPVLILSDVGDNRDPFATSSMYWRALRDNHKDATMRVWPVNGHFPSDPVRTLDVYEHWIDYIAAHMK
ncbi:MAG TPA: S9 family peptidase [Candidatus Eremiobacteraceae bacterium]